MTEPRVVLRDTEENRALVNNVHGKQAGIDHDPRRGVFVDDWQSP